MIITGTRRLRRGAGDAHRVRRGHDRHRHGAGRQSAPDRPPAGMADALADARHPRCHGAPAARFEPRQSARETPLIVVVGREAPGRAQGRARARPARRSVEVDAAPGGVDLAEALRALADEGFTRVFAEGGAEVAASLVAGDLVDEVVIFRAPVVVGPDGVRALGRHGALGDRAQPALPPGRDRDRRRRHHAPLSCGHDLIDVHRHRQRRRHGDRRRRAERRAPHRDRLPL